MVDICITGTITTDQINKFFCEQLIMLLLRCYIPYDGPSKNDKVITINLIDMYDWNCEFESHSRHGCMSLIVLHV
jgi:hypothetical protein